LFINVDVFFPPRERGPKLGLASKFEARPFLFFFPLFYYRPEFLLNLAENSPYFTEIGKLLFFPFPQRDRISPPPSTPSARQSMPWTTPFSLSLGDGREDTSACRTPPVFFLPFPQKKATSSFSHSLFFSYFDCGAA